MTELEELIVIQGVQVQNWKICGLFYQNRLLVQMLIAFTDIVVKNKISLNRFINLVLWS